MAAETRLADIRAFLRLSGQIGTAGQPTKEQFGAIKEAGYQVVVNLLPPTSPSALPEEPQAVSALGMEYVSIPVDWEAPKPEDAEQFFAVMDERRGRKVFVHCAANMRVSAFLYLYRTLRLGIDEETARRDLHRIWVPEGCWGQFLEEAARHLSSRPAEETG